MHTTLVVGPLLAILLTGLSLSVFYGIPPVPTQSPTTRQPTLSPTPPTKTPTKNPTLNPTLNPTPPTKTPTKNPTLNPVLQLTYCPTQTQPLTSPTPTISTQTPTHLYTIDYLAGTLTARDTAGTITNTSPIPTFLFWMTLDPPTQNILIASIDEVFRYTTTGTLISSFSTGIEFDTTGLAANGSGYIFTGSNTSPRPIRIWSPSGVLIRSIPSSDLTWGDNYYITLLIQPSTGNLFVSISDPLGAPNQDQINVFSPPGDYQNRIRVLGGPGEGGVMMFDVFGYLWTRTRIPPLTDEKLTCLDPQTFLPITEIFGPPSTRIQPLASFPGQNGNLWTVQGGTQFQGGQFRIFTQGATCSPF